MKNKVVIITGATGFIGYSLAEYYLSQGAEVFGVGRTEEKFFELSKQPNFHKIVLDFEQYEKIYEILKGKEIDYFFHASYRGVSGPKKCDYNVQLQNLEISCLTVKIAARLKCKRYIYIGSVDEYEIAKAPDSTFYEPTHSRIYATIKYSSEVIGKTIAYDEGLDYVAVLLALTYGKGNKTNILPNVLIRNSIQHKEVNLIEGNNYFDMIHISEAIQGIISVAECGKSFESYYVGHENLRTFKEIVEEISSIIGNQMPLKFGTYPDPAFSLDYSQINRAKLFNDTGFRCECSLKDAILVTKEWIESNKFF